MCLADSISFFFYLLSYVVYDSVTSRLKTNFALKIQILESQHDALVGLLSGL